MADMTIRPCAILCLLFTDLPLYAFRRMTDLGAIQILFHPDEYQRLYNCNAYDVDDIPLADRQHPLPGTVYIVLFVVYEVSQYSGV